MLPTPGDVHVNAPLTGMSLLMAQSMADFVADRAAPNIPSDKQSNVFYKFTKDYWFRDSLVKRGPGAAAEELGYGVATDSFFCDVWAGKKPIADQVRSNEDMPLNSDRNAVQFVTQLERIRREKSFASAFLTTGVWTTDLAGGNGSGDFEEWNDYTNSTPFINVSSWKTTVQLLTGFRPNKLILGQQVWDQLRNHPDMIDRIKAGGAPGAPVPTLVTPMAAAQALELDELLIMSAVENTAKEGAAFSGSYISGKKGLLFYQPPNPGVEVAAAMYTFTWSQYAGNANGTRIKKYREEARASDMVEIESAFTHKAVGADLGLYLATMVA